jgi:hypothetical protein
MKTTLDLNDALLTDAKALAARQRTSLTRLIEEGLQLRLRARPAQTRPMRLPSIVERAGSLRGSTDSSTKPCWTPPIVTPDVKC